jgi:hypothetical protein
MKCRNHGVRGMFNPQEIRTRDVAIRLGGLAMLPLGALSIDLLYKLVHHRPHPATFLELCLAAASFLFLSIGSALLMLGSHLLDKVEISPRWARQPARPQRRWFSPDELLARTNPRVTASLPDTIAHPATSDLE